MQCAIGRRDAVAVEMNDDLQYVVGGWSAPRGLWGSTLLPLGGDSSPGFIGSRAPNVFLFEKGFQFSVFVEIVWCIPSQE